MVERDVTLSDSTEGGLKHAPLSYVVSLDAGLEDLETCDEVDVFENDVFSEEESGSV